MKLKTLDAIPRNQFLGFIVAIVIAFLTNASKLEGDWSEYIYLFGWKFIQQPLWSFCIGFFGNTLILTLVVVFGIERPGVNHFVTELIKALRDGKLSPEEKLHLIEILKDEFLGQWADLSNYVYGKEKIEPID